jgi:hypothetical protein
MRLWIPEDRLSHHIQICGRTGTRKSSIIRGFVDQAIARGWPCVFLDCKREYWEEYGDPDRDALIDPLDTRSVDWLIGNESIDEARGISVMDAAYPDVHGKAAFFQEYARSVTACVNARFHPDCTTLAAWFCDRKELIKRVKGTEYEETLANADGELANSIIATINQFGRSLRLMALAKGAKPFSVRTWGEMGKRRVGHIFLSSEPDTRKALMPIHTLIFDQALIALEKHGGPAFVVGDEIPTLHSKQLSTAMRLLRSAGCPILLGYQDFPTMADTFGQRQAESIVSNAYTQIVLGQNEPNTAEWSSKLLGLPTDIERKEEYRNSHWWQKHQHNTRTEIVRESAVSGGEIQDLEDGCGFLKQAGNITQLKVKWRPSNPRIPRLIPRTITPMPIVEESEEPKPPVRSRYSRKPTELPVV